MFWLVAGIMAVQQAGISLPAKPSPGWVGGAQRTITGNKIFDYMDGAGELYLAYGYKKLFVREYSHAGQPTVTCEVYLMPTSADAFGLLSQDRTGKKVAVGQDATYSSGLLVSWQGNYFIRILADSLTPEAERFILELGKQVAKLCGPPGKPPRAIEWLPTQGLVADSIHYFHTQLCLNYLYFVAVDNILNLSLKTEAVMGTYQSPAGKSIVLAVGYPDESEAKSAQAKFAAGYLKDLKPEGEYSVVKLENGKWLANKTMANRLFVVLESPSREECTTLIKALLDRASAKAGG